MIDWLVDNYTWLLPLATCLLASLANVITPHPDRIGGPVRRLLALALDLISTLQSRDAGAPPAAVRGIRPKLPIVQLSAKADAPVSARDVLKLPTKKRDELMARAADGAERDYTA